MCTLKPLTCFGSVQVVNSKTGLFEDVFLPEGYILVLPGYTLQRATCGIYKAAAHRVVNQNLLLFKSTCVLLHAVNNGCCVCVLIFGIKRTQSRQSFVVFWLHRQFRDMEGVRFAVTFKLRSPDTALLDFHTALTAAGKQVEPRYMSMLHWQSL